MKKNRSKLMALASFLVLMMAVTFAVPLGVFASAGEGPGEEGGQPPAGITVEGESDAPEDGAAPGGGEDASQSHTVYFYTPEGALVYQAQVENGGELAAPPVEPSAPAGSRFAGWYEAGAAEAYQFKGSVVTAETALYAAFEELPASPGGGGAGAGQPAPTKMPTPPQAEEPKPSDAEHTVRFTVDGSDYHSEVVLHETLVNLPANPPAPDGKAFVGWYTETGEPFNPRQVICEDQVLAAMFSSEVVLVTYLDTDGSVLQVVEGQKGQPAPAPGRAPNLAMGKELKHWALAGSQQPFTGPLEENVTLVPVLTDISMAVFVTDGSEIEPQTGGEGFTATAPVTPPARDGYTFAGWARDEARTEDFDFAGTPIYGTVFIYAKWEVAQTSYTLNIWVEKPNVQTPGNPLKDGRSDYELQYTTPMGATTGEAIRFDDNTARAAAQNAQTAVKNLLVYSTFKASEERTASPNGDTVVNVFFTRTVFTFTFDVSAPSLGGEIFIRDGVSVGSRYSIDVKLEQDLTDIWPTAVSFSKTNALFQNWSGFYGNSASRVSYSYLSVAFSAPVALQSNYYYDITPPRRYAVTLKPTTVVNPYVETRYYYTELSDTEREAYLENGSLPGETVKVWTVQSHPLYAGTRYYKLAVVSMPNNQTSNPATTAKNWPGREIEGYETIGSTSGNCRTAQFQQVVQGEGKNFALNYFMPRKSSTLTLVTGAGTIEDAEGRFTAGSGSYTATLQYGQPLKDVLPESARLARYIFAGWYLDEYFEEPYTGGTMPGSNLTLYARYRGTEVTVNYTDGEAVTANTYARGDKLNAHDLEGTVYAGAEKGDIIPGKGIFIGWYYEVGTGAVATVEFPVGLALTRDSYTLKAQLVPLDYTVDFLGDEGGEQLVSYGQQRVTSGSSNTLARSGHAALVPPARTGYTFKGWTTLLGGTVPNFTTATRVLGSMQVYAVWQPNRVSLNFDANGGTLTHDDLRLEVGYGQSLKEAALALPGAESVAWEGRTFEGWYTQPDGGQPYSEETKLTKDETVYARWNTGQGPPAGPGEDGEVVPPPAGGTTLVLDNGAPPSAAVQDQLDNQTGNPLTDFVNSNVPAGGPGFMGAWSLVSLVMAVAGVLISALLLAGGALRKKGTAPDEPEMDENAAEEAEERQNRRGRLLKALATLLGLLTAILFLALDDLSLPMVLVNQWTLWVAIPFVALLAALAVRRLVKRQNEQKAEAVAAEESPRG